MNAWKAALLSFFLGPGIGQLYNREYKKGMYLIVLSLIVLIGAAVWFRNACLPYLPADLPVDDRVALQQLLENAVNHVMSASGGTFETYKAILFALWVYGVVDAWHGAQKRRDPGQH